LSDNTAALGKIWLDRPEFFTHVLSMKATWQLQEAKNQFSTVVDKAIHEGAQTITRHGEPAVVILAIKDYQRLKPKKSVGKLFRQLKGLNLEFERSKDMGRDIDL